MCHCVSASGGWLVGNTVTKDSKREHNEGYGVNLKHCLTCFISQLRVERGEICIDDETSVEAVSVEALGFKYILSNISDNYLIVLATTA